MRPSSLPAIVLALAVGGVAAAVQQPSYRTLNDTFEPPRFSDVEQWKHRAAYLREHILASAGLMPMPERTPLRPEIFGEVKRADYSVAKVYFESLPGFFVTGNLYRPAGDGPFPAILAPHGHWAYGRLENTSLNSVPGRAINLARQGFVVLTHDMVGYGDSRQLPHTFGGRRETLWGLSLAGLQLWNAIRALDFLESLPYVQRDALGATGESGGGTQTFLLAAVDERVKVAVPVNMISLHMQGGCLCENPPGLRLDTTNVEIAATIAPRPLLMVSATGDWTKNTLEREYPAVRALYALMGAADRVHAVRFDAEHNYNRDSREAMYAWMARWFKQAPTDVRIPERSFTPEPPADLLVFHQRTLPDHAVTPATLTAHWIDAATRQLSTSAPRTLGRALNHALGFGETTSAPRSNGARGRERVVLLADTDPDLTPRLRAAGFTVRPIVFTPFDSAAAEKVRHFDTYNRTAAGRRVADIVAALRNNPDAALVASGDAALAGLLASAVSSPQVAILDVDTFDTSSDAAFVERLYIPGLRRAGDLQTAAALAGDRIVIHGAGERFTLKGVTVQRAKLTPREIARTLSRRLTR
ncbi:MAG: alpha/beta hydrolase family protein [Vicinamibacterales bacterium]